MSHDCERIPSSLEFSETMLKMKCSLLYATVLICSLLVIYCVINKSERGASSIFLQMCSPTKNDFPENKESIQKAGELIRSSDESAPRLPCCFCIWISYIKRFECVFLMENEFFLTRCIRVALKSGCCADSILKYVTRTRSVSSDFRVKLACLSKKVKSSVSEGKSFDLYTYICSDYSTDVIFVKC